MRLLQTALVFLHYPALMVVTGLSERCDITERERDCSCVSGLWFRCSASLCFIEAASHENQSRSFEREPAHGHWSTIYKRSIGGLLGLLNCGIMGSFCAPNLSSIHDSHRTRQLFFSLEGSLNKQFLRELQSQTPSAVVCSAGAVKRSINLKTMTDVRENCREAFRVYTFNTWFMNNPGWINHETAGAKCLYESDNINKSSTWSTDKT